MHNGERDNQHISPQMIFEYFSLMYFILKIENSIFWKPIRTIFIQIILLRIFLLLHKVLASEVFPYHFCIIERTRENIRNDTALFSSYSTHNWVLVGLEKVEQHDSSGVLGFEV